MPLFSKKIYPLTEEDQLQILRQVFKSLDIRDIPTYGNEQEELDVYLATPQATYLILKDHYNCYISNKELSRQLDSVAQSMGFNLSRHGTGSNEFFNELLGFEASLRPLTMNIDLEAIKSKGDYRRYDDYIEALVRYEALASGANETDWESIRSTFALVDQTTEDYRAKLN